MENQNSHAIRRGGGGRVGTWRGVGTWPAYLPRFVSGGGSGVVSDIEVVGTQKVSDDKLRVHFYHLNFPDRLELVHWSICERGRSLPSTERDAVERGVPCYLLADVSLVPCKRTSTRHP